MGGVEGGERRFICSRLSWSWSKGEVEGRRSMGSTTHGPARHFRLIVEVSTTYLPIIRGHDVGD